MASVQFGQHAPAARVILHLSDTHLLGGERLLGGRYDTAVHLRRTLAAAEATGVRPDAVVFTGDLTDLGEPEAYRALREAVEPWAEALGGAGGVGGGQSRRAARDARRAPRRRGHRGSDHERARPRRLAADRAGFHRARLAPRRPRPGAARMAAGRTGNARPAGDDPRAAPSAASHPHPLLRHPRAARSGGLGRGDCGQRCARDPRGPSALLHVGHVRGGARERRRGILLHDGPRPTGRRRQRDGCGRSFHLVHVWDDTITHAVVPVVDAEATGYFTPEWTAEMAALSPEERLEAFSRKRATGQ